MDNMIRIDKDYVEWLKHVKKRFKNTQIKASIKVNDELLRFYWSIGKDIVNMQAESKWGGAFCTIYLPTTGIRAIQIAAIRILVYRRSGFGDLSALLPP